MGSLAGAYLHRAIDKEVTVVVNSFLGRGQYEFDREAFLDAFDKRFPFYVIHEDNMQRSRVLMSLHKNYGSLIFKSENSKRAKRLKRKPRSNQMPTSSDDATTSSDGRAIR